MGGSAAALSLVSPLGRDISHYVAPFLMAEMILSLRPCSFLAPPLIVVSVVLWGWLIAFQNCTYSFSFRGVAFSSFWLNLLWTVFLSHCNLILYGFYVENVRPCFFQNTHINAIKPPPGPKAYSVTSENEGFYPLWEEKKKSCHFHLIVSQPNPMIWESTLALK